MGVIRRTASALLAGALALGITPGSGATPRPASAPVGRLRVSETYNDHLHKGQNGESWLQMAAHGFRLNCTIPLDPYEDPLADAADNWTLRLEFRDSLGENSKTFSFSSDRCNWAPGRRSVRWNFPPFEIATARWSRKTLRVSVLSAIGELAHDRVGGEPGDFTDGLDCRVQLGDLDAGTGLDEPLVGTLSGRAWSVDRTVMVYDSYSYVDVPATYTLWNARVKGKAEGTAP